LACLIFSLRDSAALLQGERNKALLRDALKDLLPERVYRNKGRVGFYEPVRMFFAPALQPLVMDTVHSADFQQSPFWDGRAVAAAIQRIYAREPVPQSAAIWRCVVAGMLMGQFRDRAQASRD
jgi:asparagine synthase (glutamine-hydrolysing)